jgi:hypothetical protein
VSPIRLQNNTNYTVQGVLYDGTDSTSPTTISGLMDMMDPLVPINLARYWVYKFDNYSKSYANWVQIGEKVL